MCSKAYSNRKYHINTDSNDIANTVHTAGFTVTLYELISYLEPIATNILFFNTDKVLSTTLFEQRVFCQKSNRLWSVRYDIGIILWYFVHTLLIATLRSTVSCLCAFAGHVLGISSCLHYYVDDFYDVIYTNNCNWTLVLVILFLHDCCLDIIGPVSQ